MGGEAGRGADTSGARNPNVGVTELSLASNSRAGGLWGSWSPGMGAPHSPSPHAGSRKIPCPADGTSITLL